MLNAPVQANAVRDRVASWSENLAGARSALAAYLAQPGQAETWAALTLARRNLASSLAEMGANEFAGAARDSVRALAKDLAASGACDVHGEPADHELVQRCVRRGENGLRAAMLVLPAWQWTEAPALSAVAARLWEDYLPYLFYAPQGFTAVGDAESYAKHYLRRLEELAALVRRPGPLTRGAAGTFLKCSSCIPLYFCADSLRRHYALRGEILAAAFGLGAAAPIEPRSRAGRKLRVGFINRHFGPQTETYTTLPMFEQLDPERFEVVLFVHHRNDSAVERFAQARVARLVTLPADVGGQISALREAQLDVAVFGTNVTAVCNEVTLLALQRVAPLQLVNNSSCTTSGLAEIDLYLSGTATESAEAPGHFTERLALVPGPTHAFNYEADRAAPTTSWTRAALGLPEDAVVFVSAANFFKIIPEMRHTWARLLARVPGSRLLLHPFNPNWSSSYPVRRFQAELTAVLAEHGVDPTRLVLSSNRFPSRSDVKALLAVGDVYLDTFPFGGVNSLVDPLELGMPVIAWEGTTMRSRMGAALLRALALPELIASTEESYLATAARLAGEPALRTQLAGRIRAAMDGAPIFLDSLAASDAFGALITHAFDDRARQGAEAFRADRRPLTLAHADVAPLLAAGDSALVAGRHAEAEQAAQQALGIDPLSVSARTLMGRALLAQGRSERAVTYLLAALQHGGHDGMLWYYVARALQQNRQVAETLQAVEGCLKADPQCLDGWLMLAELAAEAKNDSLCDEALGMARQIAPHDPRLSSAGVSPASDFPGRPDACATPPHIVLYTDDPELGGVAQYNHTLLLSLIDAGYRVTCVQTRSDGPLAREQQARGVTHRWIPYDTGREFARTLTDRGPADALFQSDRPELVIFSDCSPVSNLAARQAALERGIPYVVVVGFVGAYLAKNFAPRLPALARQHAHARAVVAVSGENLALLHRAFGTPAAVGEVIHYGRPEKFFAPRNDEVRRRLRAEQNIPDDAIVCFTAARLAAVKGHALQLAALQALRRADAGAKLMLVWAGDGDQRNALVQEIARLQLGDHVRVLGQRWDVADWYDAADIFVLTSQLEGMPLCVMEAMAKGLPVVATAVSGVPEELADTGKLLPDPAQNASGVVRELAQTLEAWSRDPGVRRALGERARSRAEAMFREELMVQRTLSLIQRHAPLARPLSA